MIKSLLGLGRPKAPEPTFDFPRSDLCVISDFSGEEFVDVEGLAAALGIEVGYHPYRKDLCGTLQCYGTKWVIGVNASDTLTRKRWTIAHEIGHYVMHRDLIARREGIPGIGDDRKYRQPDIPSLLNPHVLPEHEAQANRVAIWILLKRDKMVRLFDEGLTDEQVGMLVGVSEAAVGIYRGILKGKR